MKTRAQERSTVGRGEDTASWLGVEACSASGWNRHDDLVEGGGEVREESAGLRETADDWASGGKVVATNAESGNFRDSGKTK